MIIRVRQRASRGFRWFIEPIFSITLSNNDFEILESIKAYFGVGNLTISKTRDCSIYTVSSLEDLTNIIIPHFLKYPLITKKQIDFLLFQKVIELLNAKEHLTEEGLGKIVNIKASLNRGLTESLKEAFPNCNPVLKPSLIYTEILDPNWLSGFVNGDGCFSAYIKRISSTPVIKVIIRLKLNITQHSRDFELLNNIKKYLNCGFVVKSKKDTISDLVVTKLEDLVDKVIPFFNKYPLLGCKKKDFNDWSRIVNLVREKAHLMEKGLNQIEVIIEEIRNRK